MSVLAATLRAYVPARVEAAPRDRIWGIRFGRDDQNLLGFALMKARAELEG